MHVTLFNLSEYLNNVLQCPFQILECVSLAIMGIWDAKPGHFGGLLWRNASNIRQPSMASIMKGCLVSLELK